MRLKIGRTITSCILNRFSFFNNLSIPTHFIVVDTANLQPDHLQKLSYKLTHMYYNWPGTVRVPAPCQYAHKLAALVGENIQQEADPKLDDKLYYL